MQPIAFPVVLVLEDEAFIAMDIEFSLRDAGFNVVTFSRCAPADEWLESNSHLIAIIDITLADGVCIKAASMLAEREIPFIVHPATRSFPSTKTRFFRPGIG